MAFGNIFWLLSIGILLIIAGALEARTTGNVSIKMMGVMEKISQHTIAHSIYWSFQLWAAKQFQFLKQLDGFIDHQDLRVFCETPNNFPQVYAFFPHCGLSELIISTSVTSAKLCCWHLFANRFSLLCRLWTV